MNPGKLRFGNPGIFGIFKGGSPQRKRLADPCSVPSSRKRRSMNTFDTRSLAWMELFSLQKMVVSLLIELYLICFKVVCDDFFEHRWVDLSSYDGEDDEEKNRNGNLENRHEPVASLQQKVLPKKHKKL